MTREEIERWYDRTAIGKPTYRARAFSLLRTIPASAANDAFLPNKPARIRGTGQARHPHPVRPATLAEFDALSTAMPRATGCWSSSRRVARYGSVS